jgi:TonB family protein
MKFIAAGTAGLLLHCSLLSAVAQAQENAPAVPMSMERERELRANPIRCARPDYPKSELRAERQGTVKLSFEIDVDGKVRDYKILSSTGFPALDEAAVSGLLKCQFVPQRDPNGVPVKAWFPVQYVWSLS